jgi:uncharacterized membrane protein YagU involved in acid resistance
LLQIEINFFNLQEKSPVKHLNPPFEFQQQGLAFAVQRFARRYFDPALADAIFLDIVAFFVVKANTYVMVKNGFKVMRAARVYGQVIGQFGAGGRIAHV